MPRASEAAPWVGLSLVKPFTPWKGKSVDIVLMFRILSAYWAFSPPLFKLFSKCHVFTLLPFQGVDVIFLFHIPRVPLRLPWARRSIGLSARLGCRLPKLAKKRIFEENSKRTGVLLRRFEADLYIFKQISQYLIKSVQLYLHPVCNIWNLSRGVLQCGLTLKVQRAEHAQKRR